MDFRRHGSLCRRYSIAGLATQLSGRERRRCIGLPENRLPVVGGFSQGSAGEDLRRIRRERYVPATERIDEQAQLERLLRRRAEVRGWSRIDAVLPEHGPGRVFSPRRVELPRQELPAV